MRSESHNSSTPNIPLHVMVGTCLLALAYIGFTSLASTLSRLKSAIPLL